MKEVTRIVMKSTSGYCGIDYAYNDRLIITPQQISYECSPYYEESEIPEQRWSYKTDSGLFRAKFDEVAAAVVREFDRYPDYMVRDIGCIDMAVTFSDKTRKKETYCVMVDYFHDLFMKIKEMIPRYEHVPEVLKTEEDYQDDEEE